MISSAKKCQHHACECIKESLRELKLNLDLAEISTEILAAFTNSIPETILSAEYISWELRNRLWDEMTSKMPDAAKKKYNHRLSTILR